MDPGNPGLDRMRLRFFSLRIIASKVTHMRKKINETRYSVEPFRIRSRA